jgi:hypothetical protein
MFAGIWYAFGTVSRPLARQWRGAAAETAILTTLSNHPLRKASSPDNS